MVKPGGSNAFRHDDGKYVGEDSFVIVGYVRRFLCCKCKKQRHEWQRNKKLAAAADNTAEV